MGSAAESVGSTSSSIDPLDHPDAGAKVIRGGMLRGVGYGVNVVFITATVPLMTRHLGVTDFGQFVTASSVVAIVAGVTEFGLSGIGTREYALADAVGRHRLMGNLLGLRTLLTFVGLMIACLLMVAGGYPGVMTEGMLIAGVGLLLINAQQTLALVLTASLRWGLYSVFELVNTAVIAAGTVLLVVVGAHLLPFFYISAISSLAALLVTIFVLRDEIGLSLRFDAQVWRQMLREALPYAAAATVGILYFRVALIVLSLGSNSDQTGYYSTAFKVVEVISGIAFLMASSVFPIFAKTARDDHQRLRFGTARVSDTSLVIGVYLALSLIIAAPFVILVVGGPSFKPAVLVLRLQAIALIATFLVATWSFVLLSLNERGRLLRANGLALLVAIALSLVLVPSLGAEGAAIATAGSEFVLAGAYWWALARCGARLRPPLAIVPRVLLAAGAAAVTALILPLPSLALWAIGSAVYLLLIVMLRAFPSEVLHALLQRRSQADTQASSARR